MPTQEQLEEAANQVLADSEIFHDVATGPVSGAGSLVDVGGGNYVKTIARAISDLENAYEASDTLAQVIDARDEAVAAAASAGFKGFTDTALTAYTVLQGDNAKRIRCTNAGVITVDFPDGLVGPFWCEVESTNGGTINFTAAGARTISGVLSIVGGVATIGLNGTDYQSAQGGQVNTLANQGAGVGLTGTKVGSALGIKTLGYYGGVFAESADMVALVPFAALDANTIAHVKAYSYTDGNKVLRLDDIFRGLNGQASSASVRGTAWDTLSENYLDDLVFGHIFVSEASKGTGNIVPDLKNTRNAVLNNGPGWGASGVTFNGTTQDATIGADTALATGPWTFISFTINPTAGGINETLLGKNNGAAGRIAFQQWNPSAQMECFWNNGSSIICNTGTTDTHATNHRMFVTRQDATTLKVYKDGSAVHTTSVASVAGALATSTPTYASYGGISFFSGTFQAALLLNKAITEADIPKIKTLFNNALDGINAV